MARQKQTQKSRSERMNDVIAYLAGEGDWMTVTEISRAIGMAKSAHLQGILNEMETAGMIRADWYRMPNKLYARVYYCAQGAATVSTGQLDLPF